ncbi:MAG TPA: hypothetical protein VK633_03760 [Verrucomicrobiae bacterium]|nr:hypothetical protein [Verrucomicrobiae bacterium]
MKACSQYRGAILNLALDGSSAEENAALHEHLGRCGSCRDFYERTRPVMAELQKLEIRANIESTERFHHRIARGIRQQKPAGWTTPLLSLLEPFSRLRPTARLTVASLCGGALLIVLLVFRSDRSSAPAVTVKALPPSADAMEQMKIPSPTVSHYQFIANRSLDQLDELLTRQAIRTSHAMPIYKPGLLGREAELE